MALIKQEKLVFVLVILYIQEYLCVNYKLFTSTQVSEDFQFRVSGSQNNRKCTAVDETGWRIVYHLYMSRTSCMRITVSVTTLLFLNNVCQCDITDNLFVNKSGSN